MASANIDKFLLCEIRNVLLEARKHVYSTVNTLMVQSYWHIGKLIVEAQGGESRAKYGDELLKNISSELTKEFGKGFTTRNLRNMRQFYLTFPNWHSVSTKLSWTHYRNLINVSNPKAREFYVREAEEGNWSVRQLDRQIATQYYERLLSTQHDDATIEGLIKENLPAKPEIFNPLSLVHDPFVLEFIGAKENPITQESELEKALITHLQEFLLELGRGFAFIGRQKRILIDDKSFYPDLVFYNVYSKSYVIIDLKMKEVDYADIGQMQLYVNYYNMDVCRKDDNPTIGIILCAKKNENVVRYTLGNRNDIGVFASEYKMIMPTEEELANEIEKTKETFRLLHGKEDL